MGQRGPKPGLKLRPAEPVRRVRKGVPARPPELTGEAAREWDAIACELDAAGLLCVTDRGILAAYCLAVTDMLAARNAVNEFGRWVQTPVQNSKGDVLGVKVVEHPAVKLLDKASARVQRLGAELGLTPAGRERVTGPAADAGPKAVSKLDGLRAQIQAARGG
jgi:P27 family predicted phage terminase small subunit